MATPTAIRTNLSQPTTSTPGFAKATRLGRTRAPGLALRSCFAASQSRGRPSSTWAVAWAPTPFIWRTSAIVFSASRSALPRSSTHDPDGMRPGSTAAFAAPTSLPVLADSTTSSSVPWRSSRECSAPRRTPTSGHGSLCFVVVPRDDLGTAGPRQRLRVIVSRDRPDHLRDRRHLRRPGDRPAPDLRAGALAIEHRLRPPRRQHPGVESVQNAQVHSRPAPLLAPRGG